MFTTTNVSSVRFLARATRAGRGLVLACLVCAASAAQARTAIDLIGHRIDLPAEVHRVGTPGISMASLIVVLGGPAKLVAGHIRGARQPLAAPHRPRAGPGAGAIHAAGGRQP